MKKLTVMMIVGYDEMSTFFNRNILSNEQCIVTHDA